MSQRFDPEDEGKYVVTAEGAVLGLVVRIHDGYAYIRPNSDFAGRCGSWIAGTVDAGAAIPLDERNVTEITDSEVRVEKGEPDLVE
ncbi:MAG: hypothetical protein ACOCSP_01610 [archaeon]